MSVWDPVSEPASSHSSAIAMQVKSDSQTVSLPHPLDFPLSLVIFMEQSQEMFGFVRHEDLAGQFSAAVVL